MAHGDDQLIVALGDGNTFDEQVQEAVTVDLPASLASQAELDAHAADTSTHGVAAVAGAADIATHAALTTGVHGAGAGTVATAADIATHAGLDLGAAVHGLKGLLKFLVDGENEVVAVDEVKVFTPTAGAEGDTFKLTCDAKSSAVITIPVGGFANLTAALITTAIQGGTMAYGGSECVVAGAMGGPFTLTYGGPSAGTNMPAMTVTDKTGAADGTILDDGTGASVQGVAATEYTITGLSIGDVVAPPVVYTTKAAIATQVVRPLTDFDWSLGSTIKVIANPVDNSLNQMLLEWLDLT